MNSCLLLLPMLMSVYGIVIPWHRNVTEDKNENAYENPKREDISTINMRYGILSDLKFKDGNKRAMPTLWKNNLGQPRVPYTFEMSPGYDFRSIILKSIGMLNSYMTSNLCKLNPAVWVPRTNERDYVYFTSVANGGCWSYLGRVGGKQQINIGNGCQYTGIVLHEMLHAMGFIHEQNRCDRDAAVTIVSSNIKKGLANQFFKDTSIKQFSSKYDIYSIMQYHLWSFGNYPFRYYSDFTESRKTIKVKSTFLSLTQAQEWNVGNGEDLSDTDKNELNIMYGCLVSSCTVGCDGVEKCTGPRNPAITTMGPRTAKPQGDDILPKFAKKLKAKLNVKRKDDNIHLKPSSNPTPIF
ncbi:zinc metalloproteinase nas-4 isoform X2 [Hydra vulgaris]|uniref:Metalloendopeptidase n=1 Tax=Hydra vulgaris TaxID=6087 RepID=A0ABM4C5J9_HYDVU